jgi:hypothetical protein
MSIAMHDVIPLSFRHVLAIAGAAAEDSLLVAEIAARRPRRVTVLLDVRDGAWDWGDRLAALMTRIERVAQATVVGVLAEPGAIEPDEYDAVVRSRPLLHAA